MRIIACVAAIGVLTTGCERECGPEGRWTGSSATIRDTAQTAIGLVYVTLNEQRDESSTRWLSVTFNGAGNSQTSPLRGHVTAARLVSSAGVTLYDIEVNKSPDYVYVIVITKTEYSLSPNRFESIRQELIAGNVVAEVTTDLPGLELIRTPLPKAPDSGFRRSQCPGFFD